MPRPPTFLFQENDQLCIHKDGYSMEALHPCIFPMILHRPFALQGISSFQDSWEERHLQHCQNILQEISQCEAKVQALRTKDTECHFDFKFIEDIDERDDNDGFGSLDRCNDAESRLATNANEGTQLGPSLPEIPINILGSLLAPLLRDRNTFDNLSATCKELRNTCSSMDPPPPWPEGLLRLGAGIWSIAFSPDGKLLAVGCRDGSIRLLDRRKGILPPLTAHIARVYSIVFHPNSHIMASGSGKLPHNVIICSCLPVV